MEKLNYKLREVVPADIQLLFEWVNDEEVRTNSINTGAISFEEHERWFNKKVSSKDCVIFILEVLENPVGVVRFDFNEIEKAWEIGYSIGKDFRGIGFGRLILMEGIRLLNKFPVIGYIKEENKKSQAIFDSLGFVCEGIHRKANSILYKYIKSVGV